MEAIEAMHEAIDYQELAGDQAGSSEIQAFRKVDTAMVLRDEDFSGVSVLCNVSTGTRRPLVPLIWPKKKFHHIHDLSHAGPRPTAKI